MALQHLIEGVDPTPYTCISKSLLLQMIRNAKPYTNEGWFIKRTIGNLPDVVTNPEMANFVVMIVDGAGVPTKELYYYNGTSWTLLPLVDLSLGLDGSLTLPKISLTGAVANDILQVHTSGPSLILEWVSILNAIADDLLPPEKLHAPDAINNYILMSNGGIKGFEPIAQLVALLVDNTIAVMKLNRANPSTNRSFLSTTADGTLIQWANIDLSNVLAAGAAALQNIRRNAANTAWEYYTPVAPIFTKSYYSSLIDLPVAFGKVDFNHPLAEQPKMVRVVLRCGTSEKGYAVGDEVDISCFDIGDGSNDAPAVITSNSLTISVTFTTNGGSSLHICNKDTDVWSAITRANWKIKVYAYA